MIRPFKLLRGFTYTPPIGLVWMPYIPLTVIDPSVFTPSRILRNRYSLVNRNNRIYEGVNFEPIFVDDQLIGLSSRRIGEANHETGEITLPDNPLEINLEFNL